jgi:hypothetical protein
MLLIIVWALWHLSNVTIHYLIWGLKIRGVTTDRSKDVLINLFVPSSISIVLLVSYFSIGLT